jgi:U3 small nucleolar RNA-associated protein 21
MSIVASYSATTFSSLTLSMAGKLSVASQSRLFQSFRALGVVASDVPIVLTRTGFITVAIGKSFQVYDSEKLTPVAVSSLLPKKIRAIEATTKNHLTFCAVGRNIHVFMRVAQTTILTGHAAAIRQLLCVGDLLFSISRDDRTLCIWNIE